VLKYNSRSISKLNSKNPQWKGNKVGYLSLHEWVKNRLFKPDTCRNCNIRPSYDLTNISQEYKRDLSDWEWLCRKCHMEKDGRLQTIKDFNRNKRLPNIKCIFCNKSFRPYSKKRDFCSKGCATTLRNMSLSGTRKYGTKMPQM